MFKNYLKISLRNILKNRLTSAINILGLAIGIAVCLIIWLFISHEWSYDQFHQKSDRIFRVYMHNQSGDEEMSYSSTSFLLGKTLKSSFPEVEAATILTSFEDFVKVGENTWSERIHLAGPDFLEMFDFPLQQKSITDPLSNRNTVLLTNEKAQKYFGKENPVNQSITIRAGEEWQEFIVKGILADIPSNSSLQFDFLISDLHADNLYSERFLNSWFGTMPETYILTNGKVTDEDLEAKFPALMAQVLGDNYQEGRYDLRLQKLTEIHLDTSVGSEEAISVNPRYSYVLGGIALMILI
ncbi:MAG: ABC transporter permease, partial [Bacteroidetes bacterium]|nr:ABC transporter permease [Bacteroidota bacterium]